MNRSRRVLHILPFHSYINTSATSLNGTNSKSAIPNPAAETDPAIHCLIDKTESFAHATSAF